MSMFMNVQIISGPECFATDLTREGEALHVSLHVIADILTFLHTRLPTDPAGEGPVLIPLDILLYPVIDLLNVRSLHIETDHG